MLTIDHRPGMILHDNAYKLTFGVKFESLK